MAQIRDTGHRSARRRHDGALLCSLCVGSRPTQDNEWCAVAGCIVCDECCRALMLGEERVLLAASEAVGHDLAPEDVVELCTSCPQLVRLVSEHVLDAEDDVRFPMH